MYGSERLDKNPRSMVFVPVDVTVATAFVDVGLPRCRFLRRCACQRLCFRTAVHCACLRRVAACSGIPASSLVFCQPPIGCLRSRSSIAYRCIVRHRSASSPRAFTWIDLRTFIALLRACRLSLSLSLSLALCLRGVVGVCLSPQPPFCSRPLFARPLAGALRTPLPPPRLGGDWQCGKAASSVASARFHSSISSGRA